MAKTVLVVEDNDLNLRLFCDLLTAHGYAAQGERDAREVMFRARELRPDLIVMDIRMPHLTGIEQSAQEMATAIHAQTMRQQIPNESFEDRLARFNRIPVVADEMINSDLIYAHP